MAEEIENAAMEAAVQAEETAQPQMEKKEIIPNDPNFDWESLGEQQSTYTDEERRKLEDIYNQTFNAIVEQDVVEGTIVGKTSREVVVNIGFKSDGVIPINELRYNPDFKIDYDKEQVRHMKDAA